VKYLRALTLTGRAVIAYLAGWITDAELHERISEARILIGREPLS
jgi:hypothetical protein